MIKITSSISIPAEEVELTFSRSQGPGGQNVNKVNSKVTLHWDIKHTNSVTAPVRQRIYSKHAGKINKQGKLVITSQKYREQHKNRSDCYQKLGSIITDALQTRKTRKRTKPTYASRKRRLEQKRRRGQTKAGRQTRYEH